MTHCPCFIGIRSCVMSLEHIMDQDALIMLVKLWCNLECLLGNMEDVELMYGRPKRSNLFIFSSG